jgi:hypothetical protein
MRDPRIIVRACVSLLVFAIWAMLAPTRIDARQTNKAPAAQQAADAAPAATLAEIERKITQLEPQYQIWLDVLRLKDKLEPRPTPPPPSDTPWIVVGAVGIVFAGAWLFLGWKQVELAKMNRPKENRLDELVRQVEALNSSVTKLSGKIDQMGTKTALSVDLTELIRALTIKQPPGGGSGHQTP